MAALSNASCIAVEFAAFSVINLGSSRRLWSCEIFLVLIQVSRHDDSPPEPQNTPGEFKGPKRKKNCPDSELSSCIEYGAPAKCKQTSSVCPTL